MKIDGCAIFLRETMENAFKSATETSFFGNKKGGTGKPHKRETQILVGEPTEGEMKPFCGVY